MSRFITSHIANPANAEIELSAIDERGQGNANHRYLAEWGVGPHSVKEGVIVAFQNGPIQEFGVNGITNEVLISIVIDRLEGFQGGLFRCRENAISLTHLEDALMWLQKRTRDRLARGVEGTNQK